MFSGASWEDSSQFGAPGESADMHLHVACDRSSGGCIGIDFGPISDQRGGGRSPVPPWHRVRVTLGGNELRSAGDTEQALENSRAFVEPILAEAGLSYQRSGLSLSGEVPDGLEAIVERVWPLAVERPVQIGARAGARPDPGPAPERVAEPVVIRGLRPQTVIRVPETITQGQAAACRRHAVSAARALGAETDTAKVLDQMFGRGGFPDVNDRAKMLNYIQSTIAARGVGGDAKAQLVYKSILAGFAAFAERR